MNGGTRLPARLRSRAARRPAEPTHARLPAPVVARQTAREDRRAPNDERLLREVAAAALLIHRGVATRVVVCNIPGPADRRALDALTHATGVRADPIVRVGGGGFDLAVTAAASTGD